MKRIVNDRVKEQYYIEGHVIKWRGFGIDDQGDVIVHYIVVDEDGSLVGNFSVLRRDIKRREDVVYVAKRSLGLFPESEDRPSLSMTRAETGNGEI
jgi:hypothetical protein